MWEVKVRVGGGAGCAGLREPMTSVSSNTYSLCQLVASNRPCESIHIMEVGRCYRSGLCSFSGEPAVKHLPTHPWKDQSFSLLTTLTLFHGFSHFPHAAQ